MSRQFPLSITAAPQVLPISGGELGFHKIFIGFGTAPTSGFVSVEKRAIGDSGWSPINGGENVPIVAGQAAVYTDGAIGALRVSFIALDGGAAPALWLSSEATAWPPLGLLTDGGTGQNARVRVDMAQTGFFAGREFRTFREWTTATTATFVIRAVVPINIILFDLRLNCEEGSARLETLVGGTAGGTFSETLPIFNRNNMSERPTPLYTQQVVLTAGGTLTGGTLLDVLRVKTSGNSNFASSVGATNGDERGIAANTYYFRLTLTGFIGVFKAWWEERPNGSQMPFPT